MKKIGLKFVECIKRILVSNWGVMTMKIYEEVTVEEALKRCGAKAKVLVAIDDMEDDNTDAFSFHPVICQRQSVSFPFLLLSVFDNFLSMLPYSFLIHDLQSGRVEYGCHG